MTRLAVVGAGAWGTAFAQLCADAGAQIRVLTRDAALAAALAQGANPRNYPGVQLPALAAGADPVWAFEGADVVAVAVPAQSAGSAVAQLRHALPADAVLASLIKGVELGTGRRMSEVLAAAADLPPERVAVVSGPNLAGELIKRQPSATVVACPDEAVARSVAAAMATAYLRPYTNNDVIGVEICGAMKNIVALAVGAAKGMGYGLNTCATLMTRGLAEMTRVGLALGADLETFAGMAGFGDLAATCLSPLSRNHQVGQRIGQGLGVAEAVTATKGIAEAVETCLAVRSLARSIGVETPITDGVVAVVHEGVDARSMGRELLARPFRSEGSRYQAWPAQTHPG
ncbi:MAG: NAD(P)-dependent glycerol-3-phosphate dehydrogenase [Bifidobacteriaceae bacterium]|jgi:glycerol-3-phosphate dehydrogenase (NAD(P)+)|nr:NAD(P)-dependent glycerol-3-phosphate dehydrogenase [Bifidobacteriaceae bacterium]